MDITININPAQVNSMLEALKLIGGLALLSPVLVVLIKSAMKTPTGYEDGNR